MPIIGGKKNNLMPHRIGVRKGEELMVREGGQRGRWLRREADKS